MNKFCSFFILFSVLIATSVFAESGYPVPRFVSLGSDKIYLRAGPGKQYPIKWVYQRKGYPVEIIREYETWRKVEDPEGVTGWVFTGLLSGRRTALVGNGSGNQEKVAIYKGPPTHARPIAYAEPGAQVELDHCEQDFCKINAQGIEGWITRNNLWGIYDHEIIN